LSLNLTAVAYASILAASAITIEVMNLTFITASSYIFFASCTMRLMAFALASSSIFGYFVSSPPTMMRRPAMMSLPMCLAWMILPLAMLSVRGAGYRCWEGGVGRIIEISIYRSGKNTAAPARISSIK